ncbi:MAG TPA: hypothetical protein VLJ83_06695 [Gemmatimonadaceae bacterium]|nr:hypothetical protein [Gemmatimonadaceae bacterium]
MKKLCPIILIAVAFGCAKKADTNTAADTVATTSTTASSTAEAPIAAAENAVAPEVNPPGDIPDSQAFINYTNSAGSYQLDVPEGWARTENGSSVSFVNKFDGVKVDVGVTPAEKKTAATVRNDEAKVLQAQGHAVSINAVSDLKLPGGDAVVVKYTSNSESNAVTNKKVRLENETYLFFKNGKEAMLTLWAPQGADNVDQWQRMAKSFRWK